jgi:NAD+ kinase
MSEPFIPKRPVVTSYPKMPHAFAEAEAMTAYLKEKGIEAPCGSLYDEELRKRVKKGEYDMLIAVGGDGSVLRAGHLCAPCSVPILGVNLGRLGFMIQVDRKDWREYFERLFNGEARLGEENEGATPGASHAWSHAMGDLRACHFGQTGARHGATGYRN